MSLFNFFKSKTPSKVKANILDTKETGVQYEDWLVGEQITVEAYQNLGSDGNVYVLINYINGERKYLMLRKDIWLKTKKEFESIHQNVGYASKELQKIFKDLK
jgi:hypothetical protein